MSRGTSGTVECPVCGETFDPTVAGGRCTNPECGEWQYDGAEAAESDGHSPTGTEGDEGQTGGADAGRGGKPRSSGDPPADVSELFGDDESETGAGESGPDAQAAGDGGTDESVVDSPEQETAGTEDAGSTAETEGDDPDGEEPAGGDGEQGSTDAGGGGGTDADEELTCPGCGESVEAEDNFCSTCGEDVSLVGSGPLTDCPNCEEPVEAGDNYCSNCGEYLEAYRSGPTAGETGAGSDATGGAGSDGAAAGGTGPAASGTDDRSVAADERAGESLTLVVRNREIQVFDGDTLGREIRSIVMETGGDEEDAVRIHREHVRFVHEDEQFYLVALGQNPTVVNNETVEQGERVPVDVDDRIELSDVARMRVVES